MNAGREEKRGGTHASASALARSAGLDCTIGGSRVCASPGCLGGDEGIGKDS